MNLCSDRHDEICYDAPTCPFCDMREEKDTEIEDLKKQIPSLESDIETLNEEKE
jgi:hypothetical protein